MLLSYSWPASNSKKSVLRSCKANRNMPEKDIARLQRVQNCLARVVTKVPRFSRSVPILKRLHWLPVKFRSHFKICAITFRTLKENQPAYMVDLLVWPKCSKYLRSTNSNRFAVPRIKTKTGSFLSLYLVQPSGAIEVLLIDWFIGWYMQWPKLSKLMR